MKYCIIVPHFKHEQLFAQFLPKLVALALPCIVIDDGSGPESVSKIETLLEGHSDFCLVKHSVNRGKGAAVITGCYHASAMGYSHVVQIDADGQHCIDDVEKLLKYSKVHPETIISGQPYFDETAPMVRVYGRKVTDFWVSVETLSCKVKDSLCGFRVYPIRQLERIIDSYFIGKRMDFDTEVLVKAMWLEIDLHFIATKVIYHENTVSHFHYLRDNGMLIKLHVRLLAGMIIRLPFLLHNRIKTLLSR